MTAETEALQKWVSEALDGIKLRQPSDHKAADQIKSALLENDRLKRKVACLEAELNHTKDWARQYRAERDELQAKIDRVREKADGLLAKYGNTRTGSENPESN